MTKYFMYYIPDLRNSKDTAVEKIKAIVGNSVSDCRFPCRNVDGGPFQQGPGLLFAAIPEHIKPEDGEIERRLLYNADPANQVWQKADGYSVGYHVDLKPGPTDLSRSKMVGGYMHDTEAGEWMIPLARKADGDTLFDPAIKFDETGKIIKETPARYKSICAFAEEHWETISSGDTDGESITILADQRYCDVAVEALGINYHVGRYELSALEALTLSGAAMICSYLCDWPGYVKILTSKMDAEKKSNTAIAS